MVQKQSKLTQRILLAVKCWHDPENSLKATKTLIHFLLIFTCKFDEFKKINVIKFSKIIKKREERYRGVRPQRDR